MEKSMEALRHAQAKCSELEKTNKRLQEQTLTGRKEFARLKEELQVFKTKVKAKPLVHLFFIVVISIFSLSPFLSLVSESRKTSVRNEDTGTTDGGH